MKPSERAFVVEALSWLHEEPRRVLELLTEAEARSVVKTGYVTSDLWSDLRKRLAKTS